MEISVKRIFKGDTYTIGKLSVNGTYVCDTLEDKVRDLPREPKIKGKTAIPQGKYQVVLSYSNRFKKILPLLINVPYFEGIRIHCGNTDADTEGCILVGYNQVKGKVVSSRIAFAKLFGMIDAATKRKEQITIDVR